MRAKRVVHQTSGTLPVCMLRMAATRAGSISHFSPAAETNSKMFRVSCNGKNKLGDDHLIEKLSFRINKVKNDSKCILYICLYSF